MAINWQQLTILKLNCGYAAISVTYLHRIAYKPCLDQRFQLICYITAWHFNLQEKVVSVQTVRMYVSTETQIPFQKMRLKTCGPMWKRLLQRKQ